MFAREVLRDLRSQLRWVQHLLAGVMARLNIERAPHPTR
jgi:hypothetical protein